jgi:hypothetical protein
MQETVDFRIFSSLVNYGAYNFIQSQKKWRSLGARILVQSASLQFVGQEA